VKPILPPVKTKPEAALVAIFGERGFRPFVRRADPGPERLREAFQKAEISAVVLDHEQLRDVEILDPKTFPVLCNPYGNTYPQAAEESIRAYRKKGGAMVHFGVPFTHPVARTVYGSWRDLGHRGECTSHDGAQGMGAGGFLEGPVSPLRAAPELATWGLGEVLWDRFVPRGRLVAPRGDGVQLLLRSSLAPTDEVVPLILAQGYDIDPYAAIVRHKGCAFEGATDLWLGWTGFGLDALERPAILIEELVVRGTASILRERKLLDEERWAAISKPVPDELRTPESLTPIIRGDDAWTGRLPAAEPVARKVLQVQVGGLLDADRVLLASAQGLVHQAGGEVSVWLSNGPEDDLRIEAIKAAGLVDEITGAPSSSIPRSSGLSTSPAWSPRWRACSSAIRRTSKATASRSPRTCGDSSRPVPRTTPSHARTSRLNSTTGPWRSSFPCPRAGASSTTSSHESSSPSGSAHGHAHHDLDLCQARGTAERGLEPFLHLGPPLPAGRGKNGSRRVVEGSGS
jgi:hypothetical protein